MGWLSIHKGWTAAGITAARVIHCLYERPVIFEDDVAIHLLSPAERFLCQSKFVYRLLLNRSISEFKPYIFHSFSCQRYAEEQLAHAIDRQLRQYVILGAGLDSFALRRQDLKSTLRVFEVDHPQSQLFKQRRIARSPYQVPENLEFVPVNFELESVLDGLGRSSFDFGQPATASPTTHSALPTGKWWMISRGRFVAEARRSTRRCHRMPWRQRYQHWALRSGHTSTPGISMNDILRTGKACRPSASDT